MEGVLSYYVFYLENHNGKTDPFLMDKILYNYLIIYYVNQESYIYYIPLCFYTPSTCPSTDDDAEEEDEEGNRYFYVDSLSYRHYDQFRN